MNILGIHFGHDSSISFLKDGKIIFCRELERFTNIKHSIGVTAKNVKYALKNSNLSENDIDYCAVTSTQNIEYLFNKPEELSFKIDTKNKIFKSKIWQKELKRQSLKKRERYSFKNKKNYFFNQLDPAFIGTNKLKSIGAIEKYLQPKNWLLKLKIKELHNSLLNKVLLEEVNQNLRIPIILKLFKRKIPGWIISHHLAHAGYAFYTSRFNQAAIFSQDGGMATNIYNSGMCYYGKNNKVYAMMPHNLEIGRLYEEVGICLGFDKNAAPGKLMGLAPYGRIKFFNKNFVGNKFDTLKIKCRPLNKKIRKLTEKYKHKSNLYYWLNNCLNIAYKNNYDISKFGNLNFLQNKINTDLAASTQYLLEETILKTVNKMKSVFDGRGFKTKGNICLTGGTNLNCPSNSKIYNKSRYKKVFVPPAIHDGGLSMGAALIVNHNILDRKINREAINYSDLACLGLSYKKINKKDSILMSKKIKVKKINKIHKEISKKLFQNKIVAVFNGRSEIGPRALGHRSILANPKYFSNWAKVNKIKKREQWRPLAPSVLSEKVSKWFYKGPKISPFMLFTLKLKKQGVPAVSHVDNSARVQTVDRKTEPLFSIIKSFEKLSGIPIILNTSFNGPGTPIVETPKQAINFFLASDINYLFIDSYLIEKKI